MKNIKALSLFSGGLDSILATRLVMAQDIEVLAVQFVTPFFNYDILQDVEAHKALMLEKYGINVRVEDISEGYLRLLHNPDHGFGKNFNPCIDCKIMMFKRAKALLDECGASFLISGEVIGQRPMSQRRDTMNVIERDSQTRSLLLRPLCAQLMKETEPEIQGWVDRSKLMKMSGRGRSAQIALAKEYGIIDYPTPAGGCVLADPILSRRIKQLYSDQSILEAAQVSVLDVRVLLVGRQLLLPGGGWLILGRDEKDNERIEQLGQPEDALMRMEDWPGPSALLKKVDQYTDETAKKRDLTIAASLVVRYGRKYKEGLVARDVTCWLAGEKSVLNVLPMEGDEYRAWVLE
ncbi:thiamine biosynthesis protein [Desulforhopalus sp. 52FAK]